MTNLSNEYNQQQIQISWNSISVKSLWNTAVTSTLQPLLRLAGAHVLLLPPHGSCLRLRHPEERAAQQLPHVWQRQRQGGVPRLGPHHPEIPSDHHHRVQHPLPPQPPRPGSPRPGRDLQSGRPDAEIPGRLREHSHHVPAGSGQAGGYGVGGGGRGRGEAGSGKHHGGICLQHDHVRARLALAALLRELRLVWRARAGVRDQRSTRQVSCARIRILQMWKSSTSIWNSSARCWWSDFILKSFC